MQKNRSEVSYLEGSHIYKGMIAILESEVIWN